MIPGSRNQLSRVVIRVISEIWETGVDERRYRFFDDVTSANSAEKSVDSRSFKLQVHADASYNGVNDFLRLPAVAAQFVKRVTKRMKIYRDIFNVQSKWSVNRINDLDPCTRHVEWNFRFSGGA